MPGLLLPSFAVARRLKPLDSLTRCRIREAQAEPSACMPLESRQVPMPGTKNAFALLGSQHLRMGPQGALGSSNRLGKVPGKVCVELEPPQFPCQDSDSEDEARSDTMARAFPQTMSALACVRRPCRKRSRR